ncbi:MAG: hypothetical protein BAJALOKI2v1_50021 [Promethearchaeota archaeon]|nr:MAG: hypothetical protein BAJALOKI2v1_50021 [Candidatus Lokiarchaeota archaeon]
MTSRAKNLDFIFRLPYNRFRLKSLEDSNLDKDHYLELLKKVRKTLKDTPSLSNKQKLDLCKKERFLMKLYLNNLMEDGNKY